MFLPMSTGVDHRCSYLIFYALDNLQWLNMSMDVPTYVDGCGFRCFFAFYALEKWLKTWLSCDQPTSECEEWVCISVCMECLGSHVIFDNPVSTTFLDSPFSTTRPIARSGLVYLYVLCEPYCCDCRAWQCISVRKTHVYYQLDSVANVHLYV